MSKSVKNWLIGGLLSVVIGFSAFWGGYLTGKNKYSIKELQTAKFIFENYHKYYYYEQGDLPHELVNGLMDKYSHYYTKEEMEIIEKTSRGIKMALGLSFYADKELTIENVLYNSPAERAGIKAGGVVTKVNGESITTYSQFKEKSKGVFSLSINYGELQDELYQNLQLEEFLETYVKFYDGEKEYYFSGEEISLKNKSCSLVNGQTIPRDTLYVKYTSFNGVGSGSISKWHNDIKTSCGQFAIAMEHFKNTNKTKLILDLRGNGGGYLTILSSIASFLIKDNNGNSKPLILYSKDKNGKISNNYYSQETKKDNYNLNQITILANGMSASASEALIGAVLDYDTDNIANVVLEKYKGSYRTYGKGIMQDTIKNTMTGEGLKLTVAEIYWPVSKICIHSQGINKNIGLYADKIHESKNDLGDLDALEYAINFLNS